MNRTWEKGGGDEQNQTGKRGWRLRLAGSQSLAPPPPPAGSLLPSQMRRGTVCWPQEPKPGREGDTGTRNPSPGMNHPWSPAGNNKKELDWEEEKLQECRTQSGEAEGCTGGGGCTEQPLRAPDSKPPA
jgi:hypothetical protein